MVDEVENKDRSPSVSTVDAAMLAPGATFGPYQIIEPIAIGGMGQIYKATHTTLKTEVALKIMRKQFMSDHIAVQRLKREAELASKIDHPCIAKVYQFSSYQSTPYLALELVEGCDLGTLLEKRRHLPLEEARPIIEDICAALSAVHGMEIVHRDIKPSNIMVQPNGRAKLLDFGIAGILTQGMPLDQRLTATGHIIGSPVYMAPEQCNTAKVDRRADIYSLACVTYEMLSGQPIFKEENNMALMLAHMHQTPCMPSPLIPEPIFMALQKALSKDPNDRFQTVDEYLEAIKSDNYSQQNTKKARTFTSFWRKNKKVIFGSTAIGLATLTVLAFNYAILSVEVGNMVLQGNQYTQFLEKTLSLSERIGDKQGARFILSKLAKQSDRPELAAAACLRMAEISDRPDDSQMYAKQAFEHARNYLNNDKIPESAKAKLTEEMTTAWLSHPTFKKVMIPDLMLRHVFAVQQQDSKRAIELLTIAESLNPSLDTRAMICLIKAQLLYASNRYQESLEYAKKSFNYGGNKTLLSPQLLELEARCYIKLNQPKLAVDLCKSLDARLKDALNIPADNSKRSKDNLECIFKLYLAAGEIAIDAGDFTDALQYTAMARRLAPRVGKESMRATFDADEKAARAGLARQSSGI